ncbi:hypothetical protein [Dactylosporangium sp. CA-139066]|uniref:hypothetical protein n=1 Tax=Dactylosporangium sp. CA-139066 TaxID=3239930 RepID=UPI003D91CC6D
MIITDPAAFRERFDAALRTGPARVDRIFGAADREPGQVAVIATDGTVFWLLYRAETGRAAVFAVQEPGRERRCRPGRVAPRTGSGSPVTIHTSSWNSWP